MKQGKRRNSASQDNRNREKQESGEEGQDEIGKERQKNIWETARKTSRLERYLAQTLIQEKKNEDTKHPEKNKHDWLCFALCFDDESGKE